MADAVFVHPAIVHLVWPEVKHKIARAMERSDLGRFDVLENDVLCGHAMLWLANVDGKIIGAAVTQIEQTECSKVCVLRAVGGVQFKKWMGLLSVIEEYARSFNCTRVRFEGRMGWQRLIKGYTQERVILERAL